MKTKFGLSFLEKQKREEERGEEKRKKKKRKCMDAMMILYGN